MCLMCHLFWHGYLFRGRHLHRKSSEISLQLRDGVKWKCHSLADTVCCWWTKLMNKGGQLIWILLHVSGFRRLQLRCFSLSCKGTEKKFKNNRMDVFLASKWIFFGSCHHQQRNGTLVWRCDDFKSPHIRSYPNGIIMSFYLIPLLHWTKTTSLLIFSSSTYDHFE